MKLLRAIRVPIAFLFCACAQLQGLDAYENVDCLDDCERDQRAGTGAAGIDASADGAPAVPGMPPPNEDGGALLESGALADGGTTADAGAFDASGSDVGALPDVKLDAPATGWSYGRTITLSSDTAISSASTIVLVIVPASFQYSHARVDGADLRFSTSAVHDDELPYFIESWSPAGQSFVWVRVPTTSGAPSSIRMFYGNAAAAAESDFAATFPRAQRTAGGGAGSFVATSDIDVDWFELRSGDTLTLSPGVPLSIRARRVIIAGTVYGAARGYAGGAAPNSAGGGPGGGQVSTPVDKEASGGGGYGAMGGRGGEDHAGSGGAGGAAYGTTTGDDLAMGSGGASATYNAGGAGGGAFAVSSWRLTVHSTLKMDGASGSGGNDRNGGGGAGGGILLAGAFVDLGGSVLSANGGPGGSCTGATQHGGGGGAGGRIKVRRRASGSYVAPAVATAALAAGGKGGNTTAPGVDGAPGTVDVQHASTFPQGIEAVVGAEETIAP